MEEQKTQNQQKMSFLEKKMLEKSKRLSLNQRSKKESTSTQNILQDEIILINIERYFKYKQASFHNIIGRKNFYFQYMKDRKDLTSKIKTYIKDRKLSDTKYGNLQICLEKLYKEVYQKSKYRFRQKQDIKLSLILKSLDYDPRKLATLLQEQAKQKDIYADMEEEDDEENEADKPAFLKQAKGYAKEQLQSYRKKNQIPDDKYIFCTKGGYQALQDFLIKSGKWVQNKDYTSLAFDLMFTVKKKDIDLENISENQLINKFQKNQALTSKHGLARNLSNLVYSENYNMHKIHPRCYDLIDQNELEDFIEDFKYSKVESIIKQYQNDQIKQLNESKLSDIDTIKILLAIELIQRRMIGIKQKIELIIQYKDVTVTPQEWNFINQKQELQILADDDNNNQQNNIDEQYFKQLQERFQNEICKIKQNNNDNNNYLLEKVNEILTKMQDWDPQYGINGIQNIWIVKPAGMSRGRGIKTFNDLQQLLYYVMGKDAQWVCQKYIENPLTLQRKKFDIRQWVLVSEWEPLTVWFYEECYIRICSEEYEIDSFQNPFAHLTNNCIQSKNSKSKQENFNSDPTKGLMMSMDDFTQHLIQKEGKNLFQDKIKPQLKEISLNVMKSVSDSIQSRKHSFEMYGFDYMMDENYDVWLIEVNSSPTMEYSTKVTENLVPQFLGDIGKLINNYLLPGINRDQVDNIDVGKFSNLYREKKI